MYVLKPIFYDDFRCLADKCSYTCCQDWTIVIDEKTYETYKRMNYTNILENIEVREGKPVIKFNEKNQCPMMNERGLCSLVVKYGDKILSHVCTEFPRIYKIRNDIYEKSLSNGCPAVLNFLNKQNKSLEFQMDEIDVEEYKYENVEMDFEYRNAIIDVLQMQSGKILSRVATLYVLLSGYDEEKMSKILNSDYIEEYIKEFEKMDVNFGVKNNAYLYLFEAINAMFKHRNTYKKHIGTIDDSMKRCNGIIDENEWNCFMQYLDGKRTFFENYLVNEVYTNFDKYEQLENSVISMIFEMNVILYSLFFEWKNNSKKIEDDRMYNIMSFYARNIEHNKKEMNLYIEEYKKNEWFNSAYIINMLCKNI